MKNFLFLFLVLTICSSCVKEYQPFLDDTAQKKDDFIEYKIPAGSHYSLQSEIKEIRDSSMFFEVKFDSSAIYKNIDALNQYDVNKLYGFTEGPDPHYNSARLGWSYNEGELRLYAYVYKNKILTIEEMTTVVIDKTIKCSIIANAGYYQFSVNGKQLKLERAQISMPLKRFQQYPYFGGDETAPHPISIKIKHL